jgi:hypothetical protein
VHEGLREYLKREVPPERVWHALEAAMLGSNESARVAASRVLMDALHEETSFEERNFCAEINAEMEQHAEEADRMISKMVVDAVAAIVLGENLSTRPAWVSTLAANLDEHVKAKIAELKAEREAFDTELAGVRVQREEFSAA